VKVRANNEKIRINKPAESTLLILATETNNPGGVGSDGFTFTIFVLAVRELLVVAFANAETGVGSVDKPDVAAAVAEGIRIGGVYGVVSKTQHVVRVCPVSGMSVVPANTTSCV
jgi:hypothetical protein